MEQSHSLTAQHIPQEKMATSHASRSGQMTCQKCQRTLTLQANTTQRDHKLSFQCPCGMQYDIITGSRNYNRKVVQLLGAYQDILDPSQSGEMTIENISFGGLRLRTTTPHTISLADCLNLQFTLDDAFQSSIVETVKVRYVKDDTIIGARFLNTDAFTPALAAYLIR